MSDVIIYTRIDGGVSVVIPTGKIPLEQVLTKDVPPGAINVQVIGLDTLPKDRQFRNAWEQGSAGVEVNMPRAREIQMNKIRESRDKELAKLDIDWMKLTGQKKTKEADAIEQKRQALRDVPQTLDLNVASTPEELKALWPLELSK